MYILNAKAIEYLNKVFDFHPHEYCQDWDIELGDLNKLEEFISFYENNELSEEVKQTLMALIVAAYDNLLNYETAFYADKQWQIIKQLIMQNVRLFNGLLNYWACIGHSNPDSMFKVTPLIREIISIK